MYKLLTILLLFLSYACGQTASTDQADVYQVSAEAACNNIDVTALPEKAFINVPYVQQDTSYCGPASLSMVMGYYGDNVEQHVIGADIVDKDGATIYELTTKAKEFGFDAYSGACQFNGLLEFIAEGKPVIARILSAHGTNGHFIVVTGYDNSLGIIYINDPAQPERLTLTFDEFLGLWNITSLEDKNSTDLVIILSPTAEQVAQN